MSAQAIQLPELNQAELNDAALSALFRDLAECTQVLDVSLKHSAERMADPARRPTLDEALRLLQSRSVRGVQIRYVYGSEEWWDTLMVLPNATRVVRIRAPHLQQV
jgi:hypothetical protein